MSRVNLRTLTRKSTMNVGYFREHTVQYLLDKKQHQMKR